jgi:hypothetical protein
MSECSRFEERLRALVAGEPVPARALYEHAATCPECRDLLATHEALTGLAGETRDADPVELDALRRRVLDQVRRGPTPARPIPFGYRPAWAAGFAVLLFGAGFATAWLSSDAREPRAGSDLVGQMTDEAISNRSLLDVENSQFTYSEVAFRRIDGDRVELEFDVARHVRVTDSARSPIVQEVLAQSLLNPSHTGTRLKALSLAAQGMAPKVRESLIFALHHDENLAVRSKALEILAAQPHDPAIEAAVLTTLRDDDAVPMRLEALDYLARHVESATLRRAIGDAGTPGNATLLVRLGDYPK